MSDYITIKLPVLDGASTWDASGTATERVCRLCGKGIKYCSDPFGETSDAASDRVVLSGRVGTVHADCYEAWLEKLEIREAWLTIAVEIAKRPRAYSAAEVRAALTALVRFADGAA